MNLSNDQCYLILGTSRHSRLLTTSHCPHNKQSNGVQSHDLGGTSTRDHLTLSTFIFNFSKNKQVIIDLQCSTLTVVGIINVVFEKVRNQWHHHPKIHDKQYLTLCKPCVGWRHPMCSMLLINVAIHQTMRLITKNDFPIKIGVLLQMFRSLQRHLTNTRCCLESLTLSSCLTWILQGCGPKSDEEFAKMKLAKDQVLVHGEELTASSSLIHFY